MTSTEEIKKIREARENCDLLQEHQGRTILQKLWWGWDDQGKQNTGFHFLSLNQNKLESSSEDEENEGLNLVVVVDDDDYDDETERRK